MRSFSSTSFYHYQQHTVYFSCSEKWKIQNWLSMLLFISLWLHVVSNMNISEPQLSLYKVLFRAWERYRLQSALSCDTFTKLSVLLDNIRDLYIRKTLVTRGAFHQDGQTGQIVEWSTKHLGFGSIWPEILDNIRMRSIFAGYLRNIDQIFPLIQRKEFESDRSGY
jgi:hypothetical protein